MAEQILTRILFTSAGRRVELVKAFQEAGRRRGIPVWLIGADMRDDAPALYSCDEAVKVCGIAEDEYIPQLIRICQEKNVDLLIPTIDTDLLKLSEAREQFEAVGTRVLISKPEVIRTCRDKRNTARFFEECGLNTPVTVDNVDKFEGDFPCFIKPLDGSSSVNAFRAENKEELQAFSEVIGEGKYIIQQYIQGCEVTVDILCSMSDNSQAEGRALCITPRKRLAVRSGEVLKTEIFLDETIINEAEKIVEELCPAGPITVQLIREEKTGKDYFIEINPRFGGGAPLSMKAGADMAGEVLEELKRKNEQKSSKSEDEVEFQSADEEKRNGKCESKLTENGLNVENKVKKQIHCIAKDGLVFSRFDDSICVSTRETLCPRLKTGEEVSEYVKGLVSRGEVKAVVFDMDDTLYSERQYIESGFRVVAENLCELIKKRDCERGRLLGEVTVDSLMAFMLDEFNKGHRAIDLAMDKCEIADEKTRKDIISLYRGQKPVLTLYPWADELINWLVTEGGLTKNELGVITDGVVNAQHAKLTALGLDDRIGHTLVTDELGGPQFRKPCDVAYRVMALRMQVDFADMIYIGNNPTKDLKAPRELGMKTLFFDNPDCVHNFERRTNTPYIQLTEEQILSDLEKSHQQTLDGKGISADKAMEELGKRHGFV